MGKQRQFTRDQHIVPQWHLRKFTDSGGVLWCYKRNKPVKDSHPKSECWEPYFYEWEINGRKTNNAIDNWLTRIENDAAPVADALQVGRSLSVRETEIWAYYVASLFLRTKKVRAQMWTAMAQKLKEHTEGDDSFVSSSMTYSKRASLCSQTRRNSRK